MTRKILASLLVTSSVSVVSIPAQANCGSEPGRKESHKGNYLCNYCDPIDGGVGGMTAAFIKAEVNPTLNTDRWRPNDKVVITNGSEWREMTYDGYGKWLPTKAGEGDGPGEPRNHNGSGTLCSNLDDSAHARGYPNYMAGYYQMRADQMMSSLSNTSAFCPYSNAFSNVCHNGGNRPRPTVTVEHIGQQ